MLAVGKSNHGGKRNQKKFGPAYCLPKTSFSHISHIGLGVFFAPAQKLNNFLLQSPHFNRKIPTYQLRFFKLE